MRDAACAIAGLQASCTVHMLVGFCVALVLHAACARLEWEQAAVSRPLQPRDQGLAVLARALFAYGGRRSLALELLRLSGQAEQRCGAHMP